MRLLDILFYLLRSNKKVTINELSEIHKVSGRTIRRDLDKLSIIGIPIIIHRGANGGVEIDKNYILSKHILKYSDYESLIFALYLGDKLSEKISRTFLIDKFKSVDEKRCSKIITSLEEKFIVDIYEKKFDEKERVCKMINQALESNFYIELRVKDKDIEVYPISYVLKSNGLHLYCYSDEYITILIDDIDNIKICNKIYQGTTKKYMENKDKIKCFK